jgi:hypothetical protein
MSGGPARASFPPGRDSKCTRMRYQAYPQYPAWPLAVQPGTYPICPVTGSSTPFSGVKSTVSHFESSKSGSAQSGAWVTRALNSLEGTRRCRRGWFGRHPSKRVQFRSVVVGVPPEEAIAGFGFPLPMSMLMSLRGTKSPVESPPNPVSMPVRRSSSLEGYSAVTASVARSPCFTA